ncbi:PREDICTED: uncharacterized protein LOC109590830 isoform X2 [Amphimedon queenslandica]|uniref:Death domain-containing protein n=1 Tax=Amphimedon queenslandica TaxID=400682 RepID=A0AAN0JYG5_AMPQE|nr:PREDICTED: uncharacterized protein LOC109590830 isoform X2 [Amphimedon queenslandica]|eukprot:XP_019862262.1 PREDICTED: uncharacterized protein LOC109590830 isoform X2 [Amphimedon queenslandica]
MAEGGRKPYDVFKTMLPKLTAALGKEPTFTNVTDFLLADDLITEQQLDSIKSKTNLTDQKRGSEVAHCLREKIRNHDNPAKCLLKICDIFEDEDDVGSEVLKKHGATMRSKIKETPEASRSDPIKAQPTVPVFSGTTASSRFRSVSDRLENAISSCLTGVVSKLYAPGLISLDLKDEMINSHDIPSKKASKLVSELQRSLNSHEHPETFLNDVCTVLREVGEKPITDIVNKLGTTAASPVSHPEEISKRNLGTTDELSIEDVETVTTVLNKALFGATKWVDLGLKLGLLMPRLNVIGEGGGDAYRHLRRTIEAWLEEEDNVTSRTWQTLIDAVEGTGDRAAAQRIPDKLKTFYNITL